MEDIITFVVFGIGFIALLVGMVAVMDQGKEEGNTFRTESITVRK